MTNHKETLIWALQNLMDYVNRMSPKEIDEIVQGRPVYTQIRLQDWRFVNDPEPSYWPVPALRLELNCEITGEQGK